MQIEIWSDIQCPFCYIGKRHFEKALEAFPDKDQVQIIWKSFQLDPDLNAASATNIYDYLAQRKGISREESIQMHQRVTEMAASVGLEYRFDKAILANSMNAHRLSHLAAKYGKQNEIEEILFQAYFIEGKNMADTETLVELGKKIGLNEDEIREMLLSDKYKTEVQNDIETASQIGVRGVPFFVFDRKFAVSGAQPVDVFAKALAQAAQ
jgi:predicted DsbA family dithiol-disulfide isomerase